MNPDNKYVDAYEKGYKEGKDSTFFDDIYYGNTTPDNKLEEAVRQGYSDGKIDKSNENDREHNPGQYYTSDDDD